LSFPEFVIQIRRGGEGSQKFVIPSMRGISKDEFLIFFRKAITAFHFNVRPAVRYYLFVATASYCCHAEPVEASSFKNLSNNKKYIRCHRV